MGLRLARSLVRESLFGEPVRESALRHCELRSTESTAMRRGGRYSQIGFDIVNWETEETKDYERPAVFLPRQRASAGICASVRPGVADF
jgi:hypothetical protein